MLSVPSLSQMLTVIGMAVLAVAILVPLASELLLRRFGSATPPATSATRIPAQRQGGTKTTAVISL
jgi:hypothetical protein